MNRVLDVVLHLGFVSLGLQGFYEKAGQLLEGSFKALSELLSIILVLASDTSSVHAGPKGWCVTC